VGVIVQSFNMEVVMDANNINQRRAVQAMLAMAEIKAATAAFDQGDKNVLQTLSAIAKACEPYRVVNLDWLDAG
jgi:hypothetical protein